MAAPERFAKRQIPLAPRAPSIHGPKRRFAAPRRYVSNWARVDGMPHLELIFPHLESADGCNARLLGPMRETWRDVEDHGHFTQVESRIRILTEDQLREHGLYGWQLAFKLAVIRFFYGR